MGGDADLDAIIGRVRGLGGIAARVAKVAAPAVSVVSKSSAADGKTPTGEAWAPRKDGSPALQNAAAAVSARAVDSVVEIRLDGTSTGSQQVQSIQNVKRQIIPARGEPIPAQVADALRASADRAFGGLK